MNTGYMAFVKVKAIGIKLFRPCLITHITSDTNEGLFIPCSGVLDIRRIQGNRTKTIQTFGQQQPSHCTSPEDCFSKVLLQPWFEPQSVNLFKDKLEKCQEN